MTENDKPKFASIMRGLALNCDMDMSKEKMAFYFKNLKQFTIIRIEQAARVILGTWEYNKIPPIAVFVKAIHDDQSQIEDQATIQANIIVGHLNNYGASKMPRLIDPVSKWLMENRWPYLSWASNILESELKWWTKEFKEAYLSISTNGGKKQLKIEINPNVKKLIQNIGH